MVTGGEAWVRSVLLTGPDGQRVATHHLGGRGRPLLIAHAAGFCGAAYATMAAALVDRFDAWAVDLRGHGDSPPPADGDFSWDGMARDVATAVAGIGGGPVAFFGHSLGGGVGMRAEALTPGTFSAMYVYEPAVLPEIDGVGEASLEMGMRARRRQSVFASLDDAVTRLGSRPPYDTMTAEALRAYVTHGMCNGGGSYRLKCTPENEAAVYEAASKITVEHIAGIGAPVLIGIGERDRGLPALAAPMITAALVHARLETYPGLGHLGPFEDPAGIAARVARHLGPGTG